MCMCAASKLQLTIRLLSILFFLQVINVLIQLLYPLNKSKDLIHVQYNWKLQDKV